MELEEDVNQVKEEKDFEDYGMKLESIVDYEKYVNDRNKEGCNLKVPELVKVGTYGNLVFDTAGRLVKFSLTGEDILEVVFYIRLSDIFLDKEDILLDPELRDQYEPMFKDLMDKVFGPDVEHEISFPKV